MACHVRRQIQLEWLCALVVGEQQPGYNPAEIVYLAPLISLQAAKLSVQVEASDLAPSQVQTRSSWYSDRTSPRAQ